MFARENLILYSSVEIGLLF